MALSRARIAPIFSAVMGRDDVSEAFTTHLEKTYADEPALIRGLLTARKPARGSTSPSSNSCRPASPTSCVRFRPIAGPGKRASGSTFSASRLGRRSSPITRTCRRPSSARERRDDLSELLPILRAAMGSGPTFVMAELGAGWGPWLVKGAFACKAKTSATRVRLIGVEGDIGHFDFMRQHFEDNGLDLADHRLLHGVVGGEFGYARFPVLKKPEKDWGASIASFSSDLDSLDGSAVFSGADIEARRAAGRSRRGRVPGRPMLHHRRGDRGRGNDRPHSLRRPGLGIARVRGVANGRVGKGQADRDRNPQPGDRGRALRPVLLRELGDSSTMIRAGSRRTRARSCSSGMAFRSGADPGSAENPFVRRGRNRAGGRLSRARAAALTGTRTRDHLLHSRDECAVLHCRSVGGGLFADMQRASSRGRRSRTSPPC